jgi:hypothetical protein
MEFKKRDLLVKENKSEDGILKKVLDKLGKIKDRATSEVKETSALVRILTHAVKSYTKNREFDLNDEDREFIKGQSADVVRTLILTIIAIIPIPIPLTPFLIIFGNKIGIDLTPKEHEIPEKGKSKKQKLEEQKLNIILTKEQIDSLNENLGIWANRGLRKLNLEVPEILKKLCSKQKENGPFCRLSRMSKFLDENIKVDLEVALETLNSYFKFKNVGMFPVIIDLALNDEGRTVEYLKLISDFIQDESQDKTQTKRVLNKQRNTKEIPKNFEELLKQARYLEHQKYEEKFVGDYFDKKGTFLRLNYNCGDDAKDTLFTILTKVKSEEHTLDIVFEKIKNCIQKSLTQGTYYLKADLVTKQDLKCSGDTIFPSGTYFEVKKMDPFIDSYLSEFFSIFKQTETITYKPEYISLYNELIDRIYNWLLTNPDAKEYLNKVKSQMGGIIYEHDTIVPTEYIDLYWSNKGQRGCDEKRLSIRFRIDPKFNEIETYKFKNNEELTPKIEKVTSNKKEKVFCE